jgi:hypothetical protein
MWPGLIEWARESMLSFETPLASAGDLDVPRCLASAEDAIGIVREHYSWWLSGENKPMSRMADRSVCA